MAVRTSGAVGRSGSRCGQGDRVIGIYLNIGATVMSVSAPTSTGQDRHA